MNKLLFFVSFCCTVAMQSAYAQPDCVGKAAQHYHIPHEILNAVLSVEGGSPGMRVYNTNGSYDIGPMQINSIWLPELRRRGISEEALTNDYCTNVLVGAWILGRELKRAGAPMNTPEFWKAVGRYNSRTPNHNVKYAVRVWKRAKLLRQKSR